MRSFTSYVSEYDAHRGARSMNDLSREEQNQLIRIMLEPKGDLAAFVMEHDLMHSQPDALWAIIVVLGMLLERKSVIKEFPPTTAQDRDWIINMLAGTRLWLRLEEAFEPFDRVLRPTDYDWREIEEFGEQDAAAALIYDDIAVDLKKFLDPAPLDGDGVERRIPYQDFVREWDEGRLQFFVNRPLAVQSYRLANSVWTYLPLAFFAGLIAFIPVMIFVGFWWGLGVLFLAIAARKLLTKKAEAWVRKTALEDRTRYRWFTARGVIWGQFHTTNLNRPGIAGGQLV